MLLFSAKNYRLNLKTIFHSSVSIILQAAGASIIGRKYGIRLTVGSLDNFSTNGKNGSSNDGRVNAYNNVRALGASVQLQHTP